MPKQRTTQRDVVVVVCGRGKWSIARALGCIAWRLRALTMCCLVTVDFIAAGTRFADCCGWTGADRALSSVSRAFGVVRFPGLGAVSVSGGLNILVGMVISTFVFLGEEIGWRGYLLFRLAEVTPPRVAAILTGAFHAVFHLPLLLLTTTYQSAGQR